MVMDSMDKYENVILYLCSELGGRICGKKKLFKLLYYVDFDMFEYKESMSTITGTNYYALKMGPVPEKDEFNEVIEKLVRDGKIKVDKENINSYDIPTTMQIFCANSEPNKDLFSEDEIFILERVVSHYGKLKGGELESLTHREAPWICTEQSGPIPFELAFYRGTDFNES